MKKIVLIAALALTFTVTNAQPPAGPANPGDTYGEKIAAKGAISLKELAKKLNKSEAYSGKVSGKVNEVCANKGCWLIMELPDKTKMQIKFKDYGFFVPASLAGKTVVVQGEARKKIVSVNELRHLAEDAKKPQEVIDAITKPEKQVKFTADGVLVLK